MGDQDNRREQGWQDFPRQGSGSHDDEARDTYDLIEWAAQQPWCDGNVGMTGISYLSSIMILAAAEQPPHLKALFCHGGHFDMYEWAYHGGIMWLMPRAALEGRGGDSGVAWKNVGSAALKNRVKRNSNDVSGSACKTLT